MRQANLQKLAEDWALITIDRWEKQIRKHRIGKSEALFKSFTANVIRNSDGNPVKIELSFLYYGRFVDMGVGKGTSLSQVKENRSLRNRAEQFKNLRRPKKWYSKVKSAELANLAELLIREFGLKGINIMEEGVRELANQNNKLII